MIALTPLQRYLLNPGAATHDVLQHIAVALHSVLPIVLPVAGLGIAATIAIKAWRSEQQRRMARHAHFVSILQPPKVESPGAEVLWSNLVVLLRPRWIRQLGGQPHLSFEYHWSDQGLRLGMWVPSGVPPGMVERAVEAAWPGALTATGAPPRPIPVGQAATGGTLRLAQPEWFPLLTSHDVDPLRALFGAAGTQATDEHAVVQLLVRPAAGRRVARLFAAAQALRNGRSPRRLVRLLDVLTPRGAAPSRSVVDVTASPDVRFILNKAASPQYEVVVRYAVSTRRRAADARRVLRGRAHGIASAFAVFTGRNGFRRRRLRRPAQVIAQRRMGRGELLSVAELAALAHLPIDQAVPGLMRAGAKPVGASPRVRGDGKPLGISEAGGSRPVALGVEDARYHLHVMGATGSGKSTLLCNLVVADVAAGRGVVVVDPKGDLIEDVLSRLSEETAARTVVLLDPSDRSTTPALNVLEGDDPDLVVDNVVGIFRRIFESFWGPRTDDVLRAACLTLLQGDRKATLADVPDLLTNAGMRRPYIDALTKNDVLRGFWDWYEALGSAQQSQLIGPLMNKLRAFLLREFVRRAVGSAESSFKMTDVLNGGVCLVRVPKGVLGEQTARLLGSFVIAAVWQALTDRARQPEADRSDAALYIDECQNFLTLPRSLDEMLAEARGYRLSLVLAHQHLGQLPSGLREAISTNARSKVFFAVSPEDARVLEQHVTPELSAHDLAHLGAYQAAARLVVDGEEQPAFTLRTRTAPPAVPGRAAEIRTAARRCASRGRERSTVDRLASGVVPG